MKQFRDYLADFQITTEDVDMKPKKIIAEQTNEDIAIWNTENDRWSRKAKHPLRLNEISKETYVSWEKGEIAVYESQPVEISIPKGPNGTIGIMFEGKTKMVLGSRLAKLDEGVMGTMQPINPINRMMQLAGLSVPQTIEPESEEISEDTTELQLEEDAGGMFDQLFKTNLNGKYRNNPDAARLASIGQVMASLQTQVEQLTQPPSPDLESKLSMAIGLGSALIAAANTMTQAK